MFHSIRNLQTGLYLLLGFIGLQASDVLADGAGNGYPGLALSERIVVFGDSLSDTGNKYAIRGLVNGAPYEGLNEFGVPTDPYLTDEGIYFSNGPVWIEMVGAALGDFGSNRPASGRWPQALNYAWGGARAVAPLVDAGNQHLGSQITSYLDDVGHEIDPESLHVIFIGGNDMVDALILLGQGAPFHEVLARIDATVATVDYQAKRLVDAGARRFLLLNVPDLGLAPAIDNPVGKGFVTCFSELANRGETRGCPNLPFPVQISDHLAAVGDRLSAGGLEVTQVDTFSFVRTLADNASSFGFSNVTDMCLMPLVVPYGCADPNAYLFWDGLHPTQAAHRLLAALVLNRLGF
jgi:outer membrane lipase/esterase